MAQSDAAIIVQHLLQDDANVAEHLGRQTFKGFAGRMVLATIEEETPEKKKLEKKNL